MAARPVSRMNSSASSATARGFTLIEMVVVVALVGILAMAAQPLLELSVRRAQEASLRQGLRSLREAIDSHRSAALQGHIAKRTDDSGYPPSLEALVDGVPDLRSLDKRIYFLRKLPRDPFAAADLPAASTWRLRSSDSPAEAPQPGNDVFDVSSPSDATALDGTAYRSW